MFFVKYDSYSFTPGRFTGETSRDISRPSSLDTL